MCFSSLCFEGKAELINFIDPEGAIWRLLFTLLNTDAVDKVGGIQNLQINRVRAKTSSRKYTSTICSIQNNSNFCSLCDMLHHKLW